MKYQRAEKFTGAIFFSKFLRAHFLEKKFYQQTIDSQNLTASKGRLTVNPF